MAAQQETPDWILSGEDYSHGDGAMSGSYFSTVRLMKEMKDLQQQQPKPAREKLAVNDEDSHNMDP